MVKEFYLQHGTFEEQINGYNKSGYYEIVSIQVYNQKNNAPVDNPIYDQVALVVFKEANNDNN